MDETNLLDIFRHRLGVDSLSVLREETLLRDKAFREVERAYVEWQAPLAPPAKDFGELRPVFAPSALSPTYEVADTLQALLVAHSVAIIVPNSINFIGRLAWLLTLLEESIDAGLVHVLSEPTVGRSPRFFGEWLAEERGSASPDAEEAREAFAARLIETGDIALALDACANFPDRFDLACRTPAQRDWLRQRVVDLPQVALASQDRLAYFSDFLRLRVPVARLSTHDLLALRDEGAFDRWRSALAETVRDVVMIDDQEFLDPHSGRMALLRERMDAAAEEITTETKSMSRGVVSETATFGIACGAGAVGAFAGGPLGAAAAGGAAYISTKMVEWLRDKPTAADQSVRRVVAELFDQSRT